MARGRRFVVVGSESVVVVVVVVVAFVVVVVVVLVRNVFVDSCRSFVGLESKVFVSLF